MFTLLFTDSALEDLRYLKKGDRNTVLDAIQEQLTATPLTETRNRKPLRAHELATWEIRVGNLRAFYDVDQTTSQVIVKAVGWKVHNQLFIRGKEYTL